MKLPTRTNSYFGYETRSPWGAAVMLLGDCAVWKRPKPFQWADDVVISSVGGLGDLIIQLPLLSALVAKLVADGKTVRIALRPHAAELGRKLGWNVLEWENPLDVALKRGLSKDVLEILLSQIKQLRTQRIPLWIDLTGHVLTAVSLKISGVRRLASRVSNGGRNWIDYILPHTPFVNEYETPLKLASFFQVTPDPAVYDRLLKACPPLVTARPLPEQYIALATTCIKWRKWPLSYFAQLVASLPEHKFVLLGQRAEILLSERPILQELERNRRVTNLLDETNVLQLIQVIAVAQAIVTPDTSALHIATAYETPGVVVFGPQIAEVWTPPISPVVPHLRILQDRSCPHFPCNHHVRCRRPDDWCMAKTRPEEVQRELIKQMDSKR